MTLLRRTISKLPKYSLLFRAFSSEPPVQEVSIPVPWGEIRGKWWGPKDQRPILCLHGWQDNCGSFDRLIPLLSRRRGYLAIDFPGHGYSSPIPAGCFYNITVYLLTIEYVRRYFNWPKLSLVSHSMGSAASLFYALIYPHRVRFIVSIDAQLPIFSNGYINWISVSWEDFPRTIELSARDKEPPSYTIEELKKKLHTPLQGSIALPFTKHILKRNVAPSKQNPGKYFFSRDPRLRHSDMFTLTHSELMENIRNVKCPIFFVSSSDYRSLRENFYEILEVLRQNGVDCELHRVNGTHHVHLNNPEVFSKPLSDFILKHDNDYEDGSPVEKDVFVDEESDVRIKESPKV